MSPDVNRRLAHSTVATGPPVVYDDNMETRMLDEKTAPPATPRGLVVYSDNT